MPLCRRPPEVCREAGRGPQGAVDRPTGKAFIRAVAIGPGVPASDQGSSGHDRTPLISAIVEDGSVAIVAADGVLDGEGVLPGFSCALAEVFR